MVTHFRAFLAGFCLFLCFVSPASAGPDHGVWDGLLQKHVSRGSDGVNRFDYDGVLAEDRAALYAYLAHLSSADITGAGRDTEMAYWINFYNALTVAVVLEAYPVGSIREIKNGLISIGPWKKSRVTVRGEELSLDDIEHEKLRARFGDPRIHYAVNCASWSCPDLQDHAFTAQDLDAQLDHAARAYINHPRGAWFDGKGRLRVSSIYKWYREDFGDSDEGVIAHLKKYAAPDLKARLDGVSKVSGTDYDWTLNEPGKGKGDW